MELKLKESAHAHTAVRVLSVNCNSIFRADEKSLHSKEAYLQSIAGRHTHLHKHTELPLGWKRKMRIASKPLLSPCLVDRQLVPLYPHTVTDFLAFKNDHYFLSVLIMIRSLK